MNQPQSHVETICFWKSAYKAPPHLVSLFWRWTKANLSSFFPSQTNKVVVFLTAGKQGPNAPPVDLDVQRILESGARMFMVAVGDKPELKDLEDMVYNKDDIIPVERFQNLQIKAPSIARTIANSKLF